MGTSDWSIGTYRHIYYDSFSKVYQRLKKYKYLKIDKNGNIYETNVGNFLEVRFKVERTTVCSCLKILFYGT